MPEGARMSRRRVAALSAVLAGTFALAACGAGPSRGAADWVVEHDTIGDTVVVRTVLARDPAPASLVEELTIGMLEGPDEYVFGAIESLVVDAEGTIYVLDRQIPALRKYGPDGKYLGAIGRKGGGPGEYQWPDGGLAILDDGRILLRDPGNARINVYSPDGEPLDSWRMPGGFFTSDPLYVDRDGYTYTPVIAARNDDGTWEAGLLRFGPDGAMLDTLRWPSLGIERAMLVAVWEQGNSRSMSMQSVPFMPDERWVLDREGRFVGGAGDRYAVYVFRKDAPVLRIERSWEPVRVHPEEKADHERFITASLRGTDPGWRWNGPSIPDVKPAFRSVSVAADGRIWVHLYQPGERIAEEPDEDANRPPGVPAPMRWREPTAFDVFEPDGRYLGTVRMPERVRAAFVRGDSIWAIARGEFDEQYVKRYRVEWDRAE